MYKGCYIRYILGKMSVACVGFLRGLFVFFWFVVGTVTFFHVVPCIEFSFQCIQGIGQLVLTNSMTLN